MIKPRPGRVSQNNRGDIKQGAEQTSAPISFPAPTNGLVTTADLASQLAGAASVLENWLPTLTGARIRGGCAKYGLAAGLTDIKALFKYVYGTVEQLFAATPTAIYNMSAPAAPPATQVAVVTGLNGGDWSTLQYTNAGVSYLLCFNGKDDRRIYNGSTWGTTPAVTFTDSTTMANLNFGWVFKNRVFMLKNGSLDAYYLPDVYTVGGAAKVFPLGAVMKKGGSLLMGFSWSLESGNGPNEYCVFVSTEGEVAVYNGSDPGSADDFALVGVYQIGPPMGKNAFIKSGGDVLIATVDGLTPLSQAFQRDRQQLTLVSASRPIEEDWRLAAQSTGSGWTLTLWPEQNLVFVCFPANNVVPDTTFVFNALNGKWGIIKNWQATCYAAYQKSLFFGSYGGYIYRGDFRGTDDGLPFQATYLSSFSPGAGFGQVKSASLAKMFIRGAQRPWMRLFARADMDRSIPNFASVTTNTAGSSLWDEGLWDRAVWDGSGLPKNMYEFRQNVRAEGDALAIGCVVISGGDVKLSLELDLGTLLVTSGEASA